MSRPCEICAGQGSESEAARTRKLRRLLVEDRILSLCDAHAALVRGMGISSLGALRDAFREPVGRRSVVGRRAPLDRRVFPARPEGRRRSDGRRATDE
jgi:hypothetical protein